METKTFTETTGTNPATWQVARAWWSSAFDRPGDFQIRRAIQARYGSGVAVHTITVGAMYEVRENFGHGPVIARVRVEGGAA